MVSKLYYKLSEKGEFSGPLLKDKKGIGHVERDLHLISLPTFADGWTQWEGACYLISWAVCVSYDSAGNYNSERRRSIGGGRERAGTCRVLKRREALGQF